MYRIPVPYFKMTEDFKIIDVSQSVTRIFYPVTSFLDLVDWDSRGKLKQIKTLPSPGVMELNLKTTDSPTTLFTVYFHYQQKEKLIHLVCMNETSAFQHVQSEFQQWRKELENNEWNDVVTTSVEPDTSFEFHKKQTERKISTINDLLGIIQDDLSEVGKLEYIKLIQTELEDIKDLLRSK
ncbi:MAG: hypothetical protein U9Q88_18520 [Bacillota bacterium]|uniref:hypothetical protein n=1 Tax=Bacillus sp. RO2 TaxID=2723913 RepID=UPI00145CFB71|nr:hypothetical protein [Bacillus sp. RO2]MEA3321961.1 hypothetical protein [Bacillota bacterium]MEA3321991.1 hypothetical protein [Bacillota bacterium]NMH75464.1 hypothetical protein [Bacillus sp. RO2]